MPNWGYWVVSIVLGVAALMCLDAAYAPCEPRRAAQLAGVALAYAAGGVFQRRRQDDA